MRKIKNETQIPTRKIKFCANTDKKLLNINTDTDKKDLKEAQIQT